ncbi:hypothetical protein LCGC14_0428700 [marine sediment metagenome]|uniref:Uncharacterized protein n=1 Tax=marine sediment metagenome TaxID=412755 RepID=A0A0F9SNT7_9ZZZZ
MNDNNKGREGEAAGTWRRNDPASGYYRIAGKFDLFGQIKKASPWDNFKGFAAEIRNNSGSLVQHAGLHKTLKAAKEEVESTLRFKGEL